MMLQIYTTATYLKKKSRLSPLPFLPKSQTQLCTPRDDMHAAINKIFTSFEFFSVLCCVAIYTCKPFLCRKLVTYKFEPRF